MKLFTGIWNAGPLLRDLYMNRQKLTISRKRRAARRATYRAQKKFYALAITLVLVPLNGRDRSMPGRLARADAARLVTACGHLNCVEEAASFASDQQRASRGVASTCSRVEHFWTEFSATRIVENVPTHKLTRFAGQRCPGFTFIRYMGAEFSPQREMYPSAIARATISADPAQPHLRSIESFRALALSPHSDIRGARINGFNS